MMGMAVMAAVFAAMFLGVDNLLVVAVLARVLAVLWLIDAVLVCVEDVPGGRVWRGGSLNKGSSG